MGKRLSLFMVVLALLVCALPSVRADVLIPGGAVTGSAFGTLDGTILAYHVVSEPEKFTTVKDSGTLVQAVMRDTITGDLDFLYQWTANSGNATPFTQMTTYDFTGFKTDVGWTDALTPSMGSFSGLGTVTADATAKIHRGTGGDSIVWNFDNFSAGKMSKILVIKTDALNYTVGQTSVQDGGSHNFLTTLAPVPEPSIVAGLVGLVSVGGVGLVFRRKK